VEIDPTPSVALLALDEDGQVVVARLLDGMHGKSAVHRLDLLEEPQMVREGKRIQELLCKMFFDVFFVIPGFEGLEKSIKLSGNRGVGEFLLLWCSGKQCEGAEKACGQKESAAFADHGYFSRWVVTIRTFSLYFIDDVRGEKVFSCV